MSDDTAEARCRAIAPDLTIAQQEVGGHPCLVANATVRGHSCTVAIELRAECEEGWARHQLAIGMERKLSRLAAGAR
jgi:hypothetical protein